MMLRAFGTCELNAPNDDCCQRFNGMTWNGFSFQKQEFHLKPKLREIRKVLKRLRISQRIHIVNRTPVDHFSHGELHNFAA